MKIIICVCYILISLISYGQTKQEAKDWVEYTLDKSFNDNRSEGIATWQNKRGADYLYELFDYWFEGDILVIRESPQGKPNSHLQYKDYKIDLSLLKKCEIDSTINKELTDDSFTLQLVFQDAQFTPNGKIKKQSIRVYNNNGVEITDPKSYQHNFFLKSYNYNTVKSRIAYRLQTGIERLAALMGATVVKDVF